MLLKITALLLCLTLISCGDDKAPNVGPASTTAVVNAVGTIVFNGLNSGGGLSSLSAMSTAVDTTAQCEVGGTATLSGTADVTSNESQGTANANLDLSAVLNDCVESADDDNNYTLNGTIANTASVAITSSSANNVVTVIANSSVTTSGTLAVVGGSINEANCAVSLTTNMRITLGFASSVTTLKATASWTGTICGEAAVGSLTISRTL